MRFTHAAIASLFIWNAVITGIVIHNSKEILKNSTLSLSSTHTTREWMFEDHDRVTGIETQLIEQGIIKGSYQDDLIKMARKELDKGDEADQSKLNWFKKEWIKEQKKYEERRIHTGRNWNNPQN